ncbi:MAG: SGNH/GDSL hydrolase family protein [Clostridiales bacterium]|nr:MAG: SGNH/GDSL hydrolase family protein [Clostridiales bacterium]
MISSLVKKFETNNSLTAVFLGDSVTHGYFESIEGMHGVTDYESVYHNVLRKKINAVFPHRKFNGINSGIGGDSASSGVKRAERDVAGHSPDLTVVCYGLNDVNGELEKLCKFAGFDI